MGLTAAFTALKMCAGVKCENAVSNLEINLKTRDILNKFMKVKHFLFLFLLLIAVSCAKTDSKTDNSIKIDVSRITETDNLGNPTGTVDSTDWKFDTNWSTSEQNLFTTPTSQQLDSALKATITISPMFPNPGHDVLNQYINSNKKTLMEIVFVDNQLSITKKLFVSIQALSGVNAFLLSPELKANQNYRMYYAFYSKSDGIYLKGHGDISMK